MLNKPFAMVVNLQLPIQPLNKLGEIVQKQKNKSDDEQNCPRKTNQ